MGDVALRRMDAAEVDAFLASILPPYAAERAAADYIGEAEAAAFARAQHTRLLPQAGDTPGHRFAAIVAGGEPVGGVWFHLDPTGGDAFIYNLTVNPPHRRRGHARAALVLIEADARAAGCVRLALNVFTPNRGAIALYEQTGFAAVTQYMNKRLLRNGS